MGRPAKVYDPRLVADALARLDVGATLNEVARAAGVSIATVWKWKKQARPTEIAGRIPDEFRALLDA